MQYDPNEKRVFVKSSTGLYHVPSCRHAKGGERVELTAEEYEREYGRWIGWCCWVPAIRKTFVVWGSNNAV